MTRFFLILIFCVMSWPAFADINVYYTARKPGGATTGHFQTSIKACVNLGTLASPPVALTASTGSLGGECLLNNVFYGYWNRFSEDCPLGSTDYYCNDPAPDPEPDPCFSLYGQTKGFSVSGNSNDPGAFYQPIPGSKFWANPNSVILGGCSATVEPGVKCKVYGDGAFTCVGTGKYQGVTADPSEGLPPSDPCTGDSCPDTDPTPTSNGSSACTDWVIDGEGRRTKTCETTSNAKQPGQAACLTDGSLVCVAASPTPQSDSKIRNDDIKETPLASGGTQTDTTSTTTNTYCSAGACTTTNTTNTTTSVTNGAGDTVSQTGTCEGDDCAEPQTEEEEDGVPSVVASVVAADFPELTDEEAPGYGATALVFLEKVQTIPFIQAARGVSIPQGGGNCTVGSLSLWGGSINMDGFCTMLPTVLNPLSYLFLAGWSFAALRILLSA